VLGLLCRHEPEDHRRVLSLSCAKKAAAFFKISRSYRHSRQLPRGAAPAFARTAVAAPSLGFPDPPQWEALLTEADFDTGETMGLISGLMKAGIAKKAFDAANKPENQRKIKELVGKARGNKGPKR
jgi:hypothetical protein